MIGPRLVVLAAVLLPGVAAAAEPNYNYALKCQGCHTHEGVSPPLGRIPPLKDVVGHFARLPEGRRYIVNVPGIANTGLSPAETADLLNWTIATYGGASAPEDFEPFTADEVVRWRGKAPDDVMRLRADVRRLLAERGIGLERYP